MDGAKKGAGKMQSKSLYVILSLFAVLIISLLVWKASFQNSLDYSYSRSDDSPSSNIYTAQATSSPSPSPSESPTPSPSPSPETSPTPVEVYIMLPTKNENELEYSSEITTTAAIISLSDVVFKQLEVSLEAEGYDKTIFSETDVEGFQGENYGTFNSIPVFIPNDLDYSKQYTLTAEGTNLDNTPFIITSTFSAISKTTIQEITGTGSSRPEGDTTLYPTPTPTPIEETGCKAHYIKRFSCKDRSASVGVIDPKTGKQITVGDIVDYVNDNCKVYEEAGRISGQPITRELPSASCDFATGYKLESCFIQVGVVQSRSILFADRCLEGQEVQSTFIKIYKNHEEPEYLCSKSPGVFSRWNPTVLPREGYCFKSENVDKLNKCICCSNPTFGNHQCITPGPEQTIVKQCCPSAHSSGYACDDYHNPIKTSYPCDYSEDKRLRLYEVPIKGYLTIKDETNNFWRMIWWIDAPGFVKYDSNCQLVEPDFVETWWDGGPERQISTLEFRSRFHSYLLSCGVSSGSEVPCFPDKHDCFEIYSTYRSPDTRGVGRMGESLPAVESRTVGINCKFE